MDYDTIENSFWDTETSGILTGVVGDPITGVTGKTTAEMQDPNTFLDAGWDFVDETANGEEDIWGIDAHQYPRLYRPAYSGGDGSPENPFQLSSAQDLIDLGKSKGDYFDYFMLLNDIDLSEYTFDNSVISKHERNNFPNQYYGHLFCGVLDGNGFSVRNLTIASVDQSFVGLFGAIDPFGIVKNLYLEDVDISVTLKNSSGATHTGGICGENSGKILQCAVTGTINGSFVVGGICGSNKSIIQDSYSSCNIVGFTNIGGVCGDFGTRGFGGPVMNRCYSSSLIQSERESKGGLSGYIGMQAQMTNCFWDTTISGLPSGYIVGPWGFEGIVENVEGYTTFQMKQQANFIGWDFENVWWIDEGNGYPILRWQMPNAAPVADAGADVTVYAFVDGYATVYLDGTGSYDDDGDALGYYWYNGNDLIATGAEPNVLFGVGQYEVTLIVNDGIVDSEPNSCVVTVVDPFEVLAGDINELVQHNGAANSLLAKVDAALKKLEDGNENNDGAAVGSLGAFINAVNAQRGKKISEDDADHLIVTAQQIIEMLSRE